MIGFLEKILSPGVSLEKEKDEISQEERLQIATAAILLEVANSDENFTQIEQEKIAQILRDRFRLSNFVVQELIQTADKTRQESLDLWKFTNLINQDFSRNEKIQIIELVWEVIYLDGKLDKYEDQLVHQLQRLLNLEHKELIEAKLRVKNKI